MVSPGMALATSMSDGTTDQHVIAGNLDANGDADLTQSIGTLKINDLALKNQGVFDWEITNFDGSNSVGADWDVLQFDTLAFDSSGSFDINILSVDANGSAGAVSGDIYAAKSDTSGFKFLDGSGSNGSNITGVM